MTAQRMTALITGASAGIGHELAALFAKDGYDLVLVARRRDRMQEAATMWEAEYGIAVTVINKDLALPSAPGEILKELESKRITVDVLVNNAGFGLLGMFATTSLTDELEMIHVNITALTHLTKLLLPGMLMRRRGRILNMSSTAAFQPGPTMAVYYATKAYVLSFSEALAEETAGSGVTVTAVCPGPVRTAFADRAGTVNTRLFRSPLTGDVKPVAKAAYRGLLKGKRVVIPGILNRLGVQFLRLAPRSLVMKIIRQMKK